MKKFTFLFWILLCVRAFSASPSFQQASNLPAIFVSQQIVVGNSNTGVKITATNSTGLAGGMPFVLWNSWYDFNTNTLVVSSNPTAGNNQTYAWNSTFGSYTGLTAALRGVSSTNNGWKFALSSGLGNANYTNNSANILAPPSTYIEITGGTNTFSNVRFGTNAFWTFQTFGSATNWPGLVAGQSAIVTSNGVTFSVVVTLAGATNWTPISSSSVSVGSLGLIFLSGQAITNFYTTNITLDFPSTSIGSSALLSFPLASADIGDQVIVNPSNYAQWGGGGLIGMLMGSCTNGNVLINFYPFAAAQDPVSQSYRVSVFKVK